MRIAFLICSVWATAMIHSFFRALALARSSSVSSDSAIPENLRMARSGSNAVSSSPQGIILPKSLQILQRVTSKQAIGKAGAPSMKSLISKPSPSQLLILISYGYSCPRRVDLCSNPRDQSLFLEIELLEREFYGLGRVFAQIQRIGC